MVELSRVLPDEGTLRCALTLAGQAPSAHNTQPWRWLAGDSSLHLYADRDRWLPATDPDGRDLVISCGAALHHARLALAGLGWHTTIRRQPNPQDPDHLAVLEFHPRVPSPDEVGIASTIMRRRTDRRRMSSWPVPPQLLDHLATVAAEEKVGLHPALDPRVRHHLLQATLTAARHQERDPAYTTELALWTTTHTGSADGVPATSQPTRADEASPELRHFPPGELAPADSEEDASVLVVLTTEADDPMAWLAAGTGLSAVLLAATDLRLATCPLSQPMEIADTRELVRWEVLHGTAHPQLVLRLGWAPIGAAPIPPTPRRPVSEVLSRFPNRAQPR